VVIGLLLRALSRRIIGSECNLWGVGLFWGERGRSLICVSQLFPKVSRTTLYRIAKRANLDNP
jgi:hypothetical protein